MHDIVVAMKFGRFGREDNTLVMVSKRGALTVKILKRTAKFIAREYEEEASKAASGSAAGKLIVPKKTKLFVDQTMREREQYLGKCVLPNKWLFSNGGNKMPFFSPLFYCGCSLLYTFQQYIKALNTN